MASGLETRDPQVDEGAAPGGSRRRWPRRLLLGVGAVVGVLILVGAGLYGYARYRFDQIDTVHVPALGDTPPQGGAGHPVNILVVGSDSRSVAGNDSQAFGTSQQVAGQRADVIKVLHLVPGQSTARELSIPRDLVLPLAGSGHEARINTAFEQGPDQLVRTIEKQLHIPIDHYVLVTFESFQKVVNALGGIHLYFPTPARDAYTGLHVTHAGCQELNGAQALAVARSRHYAYFRDGSWHYDPTGDFGRIARQSVFLRAVVREGHDIGLLHPLKANAFLGSIADSLTIDDTWGVNNVIGLALHYRHFDAGQLQSSVLPTSVVNGYGSLGDVLLPKPAADKQVVATFLGTAPKHPPARPSAGTSTKPAPTSSPAQQVPLQAPQAGSYNPRLCAG